MLQFGDDRNFFEGMFEVQMDLLRRIGLEPLQHKKYAYIVCVILQILRLIMMALAVTLAFEDQTLKSIITSVGSFEQFLQGAPVFIPLLYEKELDMMYRDLNKYWIDEETRTLNTIMKKVAKHGRTFCFGIFYVCLTVPIFWGKLAFPVYIPEFPGAFYVIFFVQYVFFHYDLIVGMSNIYFFIAISTILKNQFNILNNKYRTIDEQQFENGKEFHKTMKHYVEHHALILENSERLAFIFNYALLVQYFVSALGAMTAMITLQNQSDFADIAFASTFLLVILGQLGLFCFPADALINESEETANSVYESAWFEHHEYSKTYVQRIILRSQTPINITAGGIAFINRRAYVQILKLAFTMYNFLNQLNRDK